MEYLVEGIVNKIYKCVVYVETTGEITTEISDESQYKIEVYFFLYLIILYDRIRL
jgi:hypothetical protein